MGLLTKILGDDLQAAPPSSPAAATEPALAEPTSPPAPTACPICGSAAFWLDVYGGGPHCRWCKPAPAPTFVKVNLWLVEPTDPDDLETAARLAEFAKGPVGMVLLEGADRHRPEPGALRSTTIDRTDAGGRCWNVLAEESRYDVLRMPVNSVDDFSRRYNPAMGVAPVGDLLIEEWFDRLPEGLPGWPAVPNTSHPKTPPLKSHVSATS